VPTPQVVAPVLQPHAPIPRVPVFAPTPPVQPILAPVPPIQPTPIGQVERQRQIGEIERQIEGIRGQIGIIQRARDAGMPVTPQTTVQQAQQFLDARITPPIPVPELPIMAPREPVIIPPIVPDLIPRDDLTASILGRMGAGIQDLARREVPPIPLELTPAAVAREAAAARDIAQRRIGERFAAARGELEEAARFERAEIERARQQLGLAPALLGSTVQRFVEGVEKFSSSIARTIDRLTREEQIAIETADAQYLSQVRQAKVDFWNMERDLRREEFSNLVSLFNAAMNVRQQQVAEARFGFDVGERMFQREFAVEGRRLEHARDIQNMEFRALQEARQIRQEEQRRVQNIANTILAGASAAGLGFEGLAPEQQESLRQAAETLDIPLATFEQALRQRDIVGTAKIGNSVIFYDRQGRTVRSVTVPPEPGVDWETNFSWFVNNPEIDFRRGFGTPADRAAAQERLNQYAATPMGSRILAMRAEVIQLGKAGQAAGTIQRRNTLAQQIIRRGRRLLIEDILGDESWLRTIPGTPRGDRLSPNNPDVIAAVRNEVDSQIQTFITPLFIANTIRGLTPMEAMQMMVEQPELP
jgi:hypothetical protein